MPKKLNFPASFSFRTTDEQAKEINAISTILNLPKTSILTLLIDIGLKYTLTESDLKELAIIHKEKTELKKLIRFRKGEPQLTMPKPLFSRLRIDVDEFNKYYKTKEEFFKDKYEDLEYLKKQLNKN